MRPRKLMTGIAVLALTLGSAPVVFAQDVQHGRISYVDDDGLIRGNQDSDWSIAQLNSLVMPGDVIWADEKGVLEVEVSGGSFLRLADGSKIDVVSMPPSTHIKGWSGSFYIHRLRQSEGDFTFETPVGQIGVSSDSQVRIDVLEEGSTTLSVRWGSAIIRTSDGSATRVDSGSRVFIDPGYLPSAPVGFDRGQEDGFDTWNRERSRRIAQGASQPNIGTTGTYATPIGTYDLQEYGDWVRVDGNSYWKPTVVVNYVPYRVGSWSYVPNHGHVWVGHHPFTYITSHHGHWSHHHHHGWMWSYNRTYSPAYVASVRYGDDFIWAPLSPYGDAVYNTSSYFTAGGFHFSIGFSSYSNYNYLYSGHHSVFSLHHHHHIKHHHYYDADRWNVYAHNSHHHRPALKPYHRSRDYTPARVMRGPSERVSGGHAYNAHQRAQDLEGRRARTSFQPIDLDRNSGRTDARSTTRRASPRVVQFDQDPVQKIALRDGRLKQFPENTVDRETTARLNRGGSRGDQNSNNDSRVLTPDREVNGPNRGLPEVRTNDRERTNRGVQSDSNGRVRVDPVSPNRPTTRDGQSTVEPRTITRETRPNTLPNATGRESTGRPETRTVERLDNSTPIPTNPRITRRPEITNPRDTNGRPTGPRVTDPPARDSRPSNPRVTQPRQPNPMISQPPSGPPRASEPRQPRVTVTPPREIAPRTVQPRPEVSQPRPQVTQPRPQVTQPRPQPVQPRPQVTQPRVSQPQPTQPRISQPRPQVSQPRISQPRPQVSQPRVSQPQPVQQPQARPQVSQPQPRISRPQPVQAQPRAVQPAPAPRPSVRAPQPSAPQPRVSSPPPPSRAQAPAPSRSDSGRNGRP